MLNTRTWTVVRFPDGSWSYGGSPDSPDYELCEVFIIDSEVNAKDAVKKAQRQRRSNLKKLQKQNRQG